MGQQSMRITSMLQAGLPKAPNIDSATINADNFNVTAGGDFSQSRAQQWMLVLLC